MGRVCAKPGCPELAVDRAHCDAHKREPWTGTRKRSSRPWARKRRRILQHDHYRCQPCKRQGKRTKATEVDHIKPLSQGGTDDDNNLESVCRDCHRTKTQKEARLGRLMAEQRRIG